ncbi:unnamed protein product [Prunus armeniaca]|uniref:Uncharacterized protein n=1 Tax=Prunus armeniaca TaxID=36596 RepID=A0A6J5Y5Z5_PRUAR|nr:unnamed protein product [Prunus armeniaca]CAB4318924.1 unnamed protein product [Prunus armeniaca]
MPPETESPTQLPGKARRPSGGPPFSGGPPNPTTLTPTRRPSPGTRPRAERTRAPTRSRGDLGSRLVASQRRRRGSSGSRPWRRTRFMTPCTTRQSPPGWPPISRTDPIYEPAT